MNTETPPDVEGFDEMVDGCWVTQRQLAALCGRRLAAKVFQHSAHVDHRGVSILEERRAFDLVTLLGGRR